MTTSLVDAESVLAIDLGSVQTRVSLFDVVEGQYHFIAKGAAPSTVNAPFRDVGESVHQALDSLQEVTGRVLVDSDANIILPTQTNGTGVDRLVVTFSAGPEIRVVIAGLLTDVSIGSAQNLVRTTYGRIVETIGLNDHRSSELKIDAVLTAKPDLIILSGGTESGANRSVLRLAELILMICRILPQDKRPDLLYAGNTALAKKIKGVMEKWTHVHVAPNVRPNVDVEDLGPAEEILNEVVGKIRSRQIGGLQSLAKVSSAPPLPASNAFGRVVQFLSKVYDPVKGVLGVDLGASHTTVAAAFSGDLSVNVLPVGMGQNIKSALVEDGLSEIMRWLPLHVEESVVHDYIWQKSTQPGMVPYTAEALAIEQAVARWLLQISIRRTRDTWPQKRISFEPILASGAVLTNVASIPQSLLMLLDGIQPLGITTFILDQNGLTSSLGAIGKINSILPVQVLESKAFMNLGTVISPISRAKYGTHILQVRLEYEDGNESQFKVQQGTIVSLPLQPGQAARIHLNPLRRTEIDALGKRGASSFRIVGGACGAVIDARGRPIALPSDASRRRELMKKWRLSLGS